MSDRLLLLVFFLGLAVWLKAQGAMDNQRVQAILRGESPKIEGEAGSWMLFYHKRIVLVLTDEANNRLRMFTPIAEEKELGFSDLQRMLEANFDSALDAKYALHEGVVVGVFTHPLAELTEEQLKDALRQIVRLADTFGSSFSSSDLLLNLGKPKDEKRINQRPGRKKEGGGR